MLPSACLQRFCVIAAIALGERPRFFIVSVVG